MVGARQFKCRKDVILPFNLCGGAVMRERTDNDVLTTEEML